MRQQQREIYPRMPGEDVTPHHLKRMGKKGYPQAATQKERQVTTGRCGGIFWVTPYLPALQPRVGSWPQGSWQQSGAEDVGGLLMSPVPELRAAGGLQRLEMPPCQLRPC